MGDGSEEASEGDMRQRKEEVYSYNMKKRGERVGLHTTSRTKIQTAGQ